MHLCAGSGAVAGPSGEVALAVECCERHIALEAAGIVAIELPSDRTARWLADEKPRQARAVVERAISYALHRFRQHNFSVKTSATKCVVANGLEAVAPSEALEVAQVVTRRW